MPLFISLVFFDIGLNACVQLQCKINDLRRTIKHWEERDYYISLLHWTEGTLNPYSYSISPSS
jgi:hypothetical protein